jgi:hypothetical protein
VAVGLKVEGPGIPVGASDDRTREVQVYPGCDFFNLISSYAIPNNQ